MSSMNGRLDDLEGGDLSERTYRSGRRIRPVPYARQEDLDDLGQSVNDLASQVEEQLAGLVARQVLLERALTAVIEDIYDIGKPGENVYANGETNEELSEAIEEESLGGLTAEEQREWSPEDAVRAFEAANDAPAALDPNDIVDVPEEGNPVG